MAFPHRLRNLESWQRFTLLDMLLLQAAFAIGLSLAWSLWLAEKREGGAQPIAVAVVFGSVVAGPMVLLAQCWLRRRLTPFSAGEWLWLASALTWLLFCLWRAFVGLYLRRTYALHADGDALILLLEIGAVGFLFLLAIAYTLGWMLLFPLVIRAFLEEREPVPWEPVPCRWTDRFGVVASLLWGIWLWYVCFGGDAAGWVVW